MFSINLEINANNIRVLSLLHWCNKEFQCSEMQSHVTRSMKNATTLEYEGSIFLSKVKNHLPRDAVSYPRRLEPQGNNDLLK
jgi:hypothetical protein